jgi:hypothetical protein
MKKILLRTEILRTAMILLQETRHSTALTTDEVKQRSMQHEPERKLDVPADQCRQSPHFKGFEQKLITSS